MVSALPGPACAQEYHNVRIYDFYHMLIVKKCSSVSLLNAILIKLRLPYAYYPLYVSVILSVMYDQHRNGQRVEELKLGYACPLDNIIDSSDSSDTVDVEASAQTLRVALTKCTSPAQRLRCACVGTKLRSDPAEDGTTNAVNLLWEQIGHIIPPSKVEKGEDNKVTETQQFVYETDSEGRLVLPNGLKILAHWESAPEETAFLYEEIFKRQVYARGVAQLKPGDLVVDVGEYSV